ncbi:unnamed protein product, partial [Durusdinium trenchii]
GDHFPSAAGIFGRKWPRCPGTGPAMGRRRCRSGDLRLLLPLGLGPLGRRRSQVSPGCVAFCRPAFADRHLPAGTRHSAVVSIFTGHQLLVFDDDVSGANGRSSSAFTTPSSAFTLTDLLFLALGCGDLLSTALYARDASCHALQLGDALVQEQLRRFQRWQDIPTAALPTSSGAIAQMAEEMLGVVWALNFARLGASLGSPARAAMRRLSQILDGPKVKRLAQQTMVPAEPLSSD